MMWNYLPNIVKIRGLTIKKRRKNGLFLLTFVDKNRDT